MRRQCRLIVVFIMAYWTLSLGQSGRPDFTRTGAAGPSSSQSRGDTIAKAPFEYKYYRISDMLQSFTDLDTLSDRVHLSEPYYQEEFIGGNLGPELSAGYPALFSLHYQGLTLGNQVHPVLYHSHDFQFVETNRPFFQVHYGVGQGIRGDDFAMQFYKSFARNIVLNFDYQSHTDNGISTSQNVVFKQLGFKLVQRSSKGNRVSYALYDHPRVADDFERISTDIGTAAGQLKHKERRLIFGNTVLFRDSSNTAVLIPRWDSQLVIANDGYEVVDASISATEQDLYPYGRADATLNSIAYGHIANSVQLINDYSKPVASGMTKVGLEMSRINWSGLDTLGTSLYPIRVTMAYSDVSNRSRRYEVKGRWGMADASGEWGIEGRMRIALPNQITIEGTAVLDQLIPTLAQRGLFIDDELAETIAYSFDPIGRMGIQAQAQHTGWRAGINIDLNRYDALILPSSEGRYTQEDRTTTILHMTTHAALDIGPFKSHHRFFYQYIDNPNLLRPELQYFGNLYFELRLFKKRMLTRWGVDAYFTPAFRIPTFWPLLGDFGPTVDLQDSQHLIYANPYLTVQVDKFYFFIKSVRANSEFLGGTQYWTVGYPVFPSRVRFGFKWRLLD